MYTLGRQFTKRYVPASDFRIEICSTLHQSVCCTLRYQTFWKAELVPRADGKRVAFNCDKRSDYCLRLDGPICRRALWKQSPHRQRVRRATNRETRPAPDDCKADLRSGPRLVPAKMPLLRSGPKRNPTRLNRSSSNRGSNVHWIPGTQVCSTKMQRSGVFVP